MSLRLIVSAPSVRVQADPEAYRADVVTRYYAARTWVEQLRITAEASSYDKAHPDEPPLIDELLSGDLPAAA